MPPSDNGKLFRLHRYHADAHTEIDPEALARLAHHVTELSSPRDLRAAVDVGEFLLGAFFEGDAHLYREQRRDHATFRALLDHPDLAPSPSYVWYAVSVALQCRDLPDEVAWELPLSHHRLLIPIKDPVLKQNLAEIAVREGLSKRSFQAELRQVVPGRRRRGRPRMPPLVRAARHVRKALDVATGERTSPELLDRYGATAAHRDLDALEQDLARLQRLVGQMRGRLRGEHDVE